MDAPLSPGTRIGQYLTGRLHAKGGEGDTYEAEAADGTRVAFKLLFRPSTEAEARVTNGRIERLRRLIGIRHPNVADILEIGEYNGRIYIITRWITGESLRELLDREKRLAVQAFIDICQGMLKGVVFLNSLGMVHRDIKPQNILVSRSDDGALSVVLIDCSIAYCVDAPRVTIGGPVLTPLYSAPECVADEVIVFSSDLFPCGIVAYEIATGVYPFAARSLPELCALMVSPERPSVLALVPDFPLDLEAFIRTMMMPEPKDRFASPAQALEVLAGIIAGKEFVFTSRTCVTHTTTAGVPDSTSATIVGVTKPSLRVETDRYKGTRIPIPPEGVCLGRSDINPDDPTMSRFHMRAIPNGRRLYIRDAGSLAGLARQEKKRRSFCLEAGQEFKAGNTTLTYTIAIEGD